MEAEIRGMTTFKITQETEVQTNNFSPENHMSCVLGQEGALACEFSAS